MFYLIPLNIIRKTHAQSKNKQTLHMDAGSDIDFPSMSDISNQPIRSFF